VTGHQVCATLIASVKEILLCLFDIVADCDRVRRIKWELGEGDPHFSGVFGLGCLLLELKSEGVIDCGVAVHSVDEDQCLFFSVDVGEEAW